MKKVIGVIPARSGSRRVKDKNIRELGGHPLIYYTIREALKAETLDKIVFSTDSPKYMDIAFDCAKECTHDYCQKFFVMNRPPELAEDVDTALVLMDVLKNLEDVEWIVCLQPTSPFRTTKDIDTCVKLAKLTDCDTVISVRKVTEYPQWMFRLHKENKGCIDAYMRGSYFEKNEGLLFPFMKSVDLKGNLLVSQLLPTLYYPAGLVYVSSKALIINGRIFGYKIRGYEVIPPERALDIETEFDFEVAQFLLKKKGKEWGLA